MRVKIVKRPNGKYAIRRGRWWDYQYATIEDFLCVAKPMDTVAWWIDEGCIQNDLIKT